MIAVSLILAAAGLLQPTGFSFEPAADVPGLGKRIESARAPLEAGPRWLKLSFRAAANVDGYWWVDLFGTADGAPAFDVNSRLYVGSDLREYVEYVFVDSRYRAAQFAFVTRDGSARVSDFRVSTADAAEVSAWCDRLYATLPSVDQAVPADAWARLPRSFAAIRAGLSWRVLFLGDSLLSDTFNGGLPALLARTCPSVVPILSVSGGGGVWKYHEETAFKEFVADLKPDLVLIGGGSNPRYKAPADEVVGQLRETIVRCRALGAEVAVLSPPPSWEFRASPDDTAPVDPAFSPKALPTVKPYRRDYQEQVCAETKTAFWNVTDAPCRAIAESRKPLGWFHRDAVHNDNRGKQLAARAVLAFFQGLRREER